MLDSIRMETLRSEEEKLALDILQRFNGMSIETARRVLAYAMVSLTSNQVLSFKAANSRASD